MKQLKNIIYCQTWQHWKHVIKIYLYEFKGCSYFYLKRFHAEDFDNK